MRYPIESAAQTAGRPRGARLMRSAALLVALLPAAMLGAAPDSAALIERLARRAPAGLAFVEVRFSPLLTEPLIVSGTLESAGDGALNRRVELPYREVTTIRGEAVRVEREGEASRTFALRRAPELRGLLTSMIGLLGGDRSLIEEHFSVTAAGDDTRWRLDLTPTDSRMRQRLRRITVAGIDNEPRCFVLHDTEGGASIMLLGAAAARPQPPVTVGELLASCGAE